MRRLTPSPTELAENQTYLVGLRPVNLRDRILENLHLNELPLVMTTARGESLDFHILQRLISENARNREELVNLSLASYQSLPTEGNTNPIPAAENLLNFVFSRLTSSELASIQELLKTHIIDDSVVGNFINLIRLSGISDPLKFVSILETSLQGTLNLRHFMNTIDTSTMTAIVKLEDLEQTQVPAEILEKINAEESKQLAELAERGASIQCARFENAETILQNANVQRVLFNTGVTFGVSSLLWATYRFGVWENLLSNLVLPGSGPLGESDTSLLENLKLFFAGSTGFLLKKSLLKR